MPVPSIEQLKRMETSLKKVVADQGETTEAAKRRATKKKLRRVQRKRHRFVALETSKAKSQPKPAADQSQPAAEESKDSKPAE